MVAMTTTTRARTKKLSSVAEEKNYNELNFHIFEINE